jgi:hypothetical protein
MHRLAWVCGLIVLSLFLAGCQPAGRYDASSKKFADPAPLPAK